MHAIGEDTTSCVSRQTWHSLTYFHPLFLCLAGRLLIHLTACLKGSLERKGCCPEEEVTYYNRAVSQDIAH
jgi:hypothetical protein